MASEFDLMIRVLALDAQRAMPGATHRQIEVHPDALVLCPIAMAGEDTTIHCIAYGHIGEPAKILCVPDPRFRDDQYQLFEQLGEVAEAYYRRCRDVGTHPQIWVSSSPAAAHLDTLAERLRYNRQNEVVKRFGELLSYVTDRYPISGQQALITATGALRAHFTTGQMEAEDEHLGAMLAWVEAGPGDDALAAAALAERNPMGVKTDPTFDKDVLEPLVSSYNRARRENADQTELVYRRQQIANVLAPVAMAVYENTQRAIEYLLDAHLQPLAQLPALEAREVDEFVSFMNSRDAGYGIFLHDSPKVAAFKLTAREEAQENFEAALVVGDRLARARARLSGRVLRGRVQNPQKIHVGPRLYEHRFELISQQKSLHVRHGDELYLANDPRLVVTVEGMTREGDITRLSLLIQKGARAVGLPVGGVQLEFVSKVPDWGRLGRQRGQMALRMRNAPWTHITPQSGTN